MTRSMLLGLTVLALLLACDRYSGPELVNGYSTEIEVSIYYGDGTFYSEIWPPCYTVLAGATEVGQFGIRPKDVTIDRIVVKIEGQSAHEFDAEEIRILSEKENLEFAVWKLDASGISISEVNDCSL